MSGFMTFAGESLKNLFKKPATRNYPAEPAVYPDRMRGHIEIEIDKCISCGMCVRACPSSALAVSKPKGTWTINRFDCVACGYCVIKCPAHCLTMEKGYQEPEGTKAEKVYTKSPEQMAKAARKAAEMAKKAAEAKAAALLAKAKKETEAAGKIEAAGKTVSSEKKDTE